MRNSIEGAVTALGRLRTPVLKAPKTNAGYWHCCCLPPEIHGKRKTAHTLIVGHVAIKLKLSWKLPSSFRVSCIVLCKLLGRTVVQEVLAHGSLCAAILTFQARCNLWSNSSTPVMKVTNHFLTGLIAVPQKKIHACTLNLIKNLWLG